MAKDSDVNSMEKETKRAIIALIAGAFFMILFPIVFSQCSGWFSFMETGPIGDTIGGITAPISGLLGAYLVFLALKAQVNANNIQKRALETQYAELLKKDTLSYIERTKEKIENKWKALFENRDVLRKTEAESVKFNLWMEDNIQNVKNTMLQTYLFLDFVNHKSRIDRKDPILMQLLNDFYITFETHELSLLAKIDQNLRWESTSVDADAFLPVIRTILVELETIKTDIVQIVI